MSEHAEVGQEPFDRYYASISAIADGQLTSSRQLVQDHDTAVAQWMASPAKATLPEILEQTQYRLEANLAALSSSMEITMGGLKEIERGLPQPVQEVANNIRMHMERCGGATVASEPPMERMQAGLDDTERAQLNITLDHYRWSEIAIAEATKGRNASLGRQLGGLSTPEVARAVHAVLDPYVWKRVFHQASTSGLGVSSLGIIDILRETSTPESKQAMRAGLDVLCHEQVQDMIGVAGNAVFLKSPRVSQLLRSASGAVALESMITQVVTPTNIQREYEFQISERWIHPDTTLESFTADIRDHFDTKAHPKTWTSFYDEFEALRFDRLTESD